MLIQINSFYNSIIIKSQIDVYVKEKQLPQSDRYRGVCSGNIQAYADVLQKLSEINNICED